MIWIESVEPVHEPVDLMKTINKAKKSVSDFQLYLDSEMGRLKRNDKERQKDLGGRETSMPYVD